MQPIVMHTLGEDPIKKRRRTKWLRTLIATPIVIGFLVLAVVFIVPISLLNAWVAQKLYIWFLLPLHAPHLNLWHVWGITLLISLFTTPSSSSKSKSKYKTVLIGQMVGALISPLILLLLGYFIKGHIGY